MALEPGWQILTVRLPAGATPMTMTVDRGDGGQPQAKSTVTMTPAGDAARSEAFGDQSRGRRLRSILRFAHTGEVVGWSGQTLAGLASAAGAFLVYTGLALAIRRFVTWALRPIRSPGRGRRTEEPSRSSPV
jgi:uncharacterized iron-regulated membrane protein